MRENPVFVNKKNASGVKILRVACSDSETRVEMEIEAYSANLQVYIKGTAYIKGNKGGKLGLASVQNVTIAPAKTFIPWPYQKRPARRCQRVRPHRTFHHLAVQGHQMQIKQRNKSSSTQKPPPQLRRR